MISGFEDVASPSAPEALMIEEDHLTPARVQESPQPSPLELLEDPVIDSTSAADTSLDDILGLIE